MSTLSLTTLDDVMSYPGMSTVSDADKDWLETLIRMFTVRAEAYTHREFYEEERIRQFSSDGRLMQIQLPAFGKATNVLSLVEQAPDRIFGAGTEIDLSNFYFSHTTGLLTYEYGPFVRGIGSIQVTWTGGLGTAPEHVPADLRAAAVMQVAYWWQRRNEIGVEERRYKEGAIIKVPSKMSFIADVEEVLDTYEVII